jgi:hypothetical protein
MTTLPPNDPNNNDNPGEATNTRMNAKVAPYDGRRSQRSRDVNGQDHMDMIGDMRDSPIVVAMFLVGVVSWFFRERCV